MRGDGERPGLAHPLDSLAALLPLMLVFEVGSWLMERSAGPGSGRIVASHLLDTFLSLFGGGGRWMPALAVVAILIGVQFSSGRPWRISPRAVVALYTESILWSLPLLMVLRAFRLAAIVPMHTNAAMLAGGEASGHSLSADLILGIGAGIYEELVFRLVLICLVVMIGSDLLGYPAKRTTIVAIVIAALAFAAHHHPPLGGEPFAMSRFIFRTAAGGYLGAIFVYRGYGVAACTHVAYNVLLVSCLH